MDVPPQGFEEKGYQSVLWSARDDNDDDLVFTIYYRGEGEKNWRLLKDKVTQHYYSWDTTTMPDGAYYLKIVASDSPSNPPDQAQSDAARKRSVRSSQYTAPNRGPASAGSLADGNGNVRGREHRRCTGTRAIQSRRRRLAGGIPCRVAVGFTETKV